MRLFTGFALVLVGIAFVQSQLVIPQFNNLNAVISLLPQIQGFIGQLDNILPQLAGVLSSSELQSIKDKVLQLVLSQAGDINGLKDKLQGLFQQILGSKPLGRINIDHLIEQIVGATSGALPGYVLGLLSVGKREVTDARVNLNELLALADKFQLSSFIPQIEQFLGADKLQQLQSQVLSTMITALGNNWNPATIAQALQQLVTQFVPQAAQMRIDWGQVGEQALNGVVTALPGILIGALSLFGKRDLAVNYQQLLAQLPVKNLAQLLQIVNNVDKSKITSVLAKLKELLQSFFPAYRGRINFDELAETVLNHLNSILPTLSQSIFANIFG